MHAMMRSASVLLLNDRPHAVLPPVAPRVKLIEDELVTRSQSIDEALRKFDVVAPLERTQRGVPIVGRVVGNTHARAVRFIAGGLIVVQLRVVRVLR